MKPSNIFILIMALVLTAFLVFFVYQIYREPQDKLEKWVVAPTPMEKDVPQNDIIPHIIHQTWKSKELPPFFRRLSREIHRLHTSYEHKLWDDNESLQFIQDHYPWFLPVYKGYDVKMKRIDASRYFWLYHYGGIYMDLDSVTLKPLDDLLRGRSLLFGYAERDTRKNNAIPNAFMASAPRHPFMGWLIRQLPKTKDLDVVHATGPNFLTHCLRVWGLDTRPNVLLMPTLFTHSWHEKMRDKDLQILKQRFPTSYATTFWSHTWWNNPAHDD